MHCFIRINKHCDEFDTFLQRIFHFCRETAYIIDDDDDDKLNVKEREIQKMFINAYVL